MPSIPRPFWAALFFSSFLLTLTVYRLSQDSRGTTVKSLNIFGPWNPGFRDSSITNLDLDIVDYSWRSDPIDVLNRKSVDALVLCLENHTCSKSQEKVLILASHHFDSAVQGKVSGEDIWAGAVLDAAHEAGYTILIPRSGGLNREDVLALYRLFPDRVQIILWEHSDVQWCAASPDCVDPNPDGPYRAPDERSANIPQWKLFSFSFWREGNGHPLSPRWVTVPEDYQAMDPNNPPNYFLGYSIESTCLKTEYVPTEERLNRAYILAKQLRYFKESWFLQEFPHSPESTKGNVDTYLFDRVQSSTNVSFVVSFHGDPEFSNTPPGGVTELPHFNRTEYQHQIASSKLLIGLGSPYLSPSPWAALCLGVPFLNPVENWDKNNPDDRSRWQTQHDGLRVAQLDEPHVYFVKKGDEKAFQRAVEKAMSTPIQRFIPPSMQMPQVRDRVIKLVEYDWYGLAKQVVAERKKGGSLR